MLNTQLILVAFVLVLSVVIVYALSKRQVSALASLSKKDVKWITLLTVIYAAMNLINLGDFTNYSRPWVANQGDMAFTVKLESQETVGNIYYRTGLAKGTYLFSVYQQNGQQLTINDKGATLGYPNLFKWSKIEVKNQPVGYFVFNANSLPMEINQLAIVDESGNLLTNYSVTDAQGHNLDYLRSTSMPSNMDKNLLSSSIFDEIYYATSAYQYVHGLPADIWVHPQLSMLLIALLVFLFGMNPFVWRFMPALCSISMVPVIYIFAKNLFKSTKAAVITTIVLIMEFMHLMMGKMADIDNYVTLFLLLEYMYLYLYYQARLNGESFKQTIRYLLISGIFFGLAISSKWTGFYSSVAILGLLLYFELFKFRSNITDLLGKIAISLVCFVVIPLSIYVLVYFPYAYITSTYSVFELIQRYTMGILDFNLHSLVDVKSAYASHWWGWPLGLVPISLFFWTDPNNSALSQSLAIIANPLVIWCFYPMLIWLSYLSIRKDRVAVFLLLAIFAQFAPYILVARVSFFYYFYTIIPFLVLAIGYTLYTLLNAKNKYLHYVVYLYLITCFILLLMFSPLLFGYEVPRAYVTNYLLWFKPWNV